MKPRWQHALAWALGALAATGAQAATVAVDVGHFLAKPGATSAYGVPEFEYNHSLAAVIAARLAAGGVAVRLIGHRGEMADLHARPREAEEGGAGFLLSIHHDSVKAHQLTPWVWRGRELAHSESASGFSLFVSRRNPQLAQSLACASAIGAALRAAGLRPTPHHTVGADGVDRPWADELNGVYYYDNLVVLKYTRLPGVLLEAGVIVNRDEERELASPARRALTADAVAAGLSACGVTSGGGSAKMRAD
ncbi:MAG: N-acetylmuramoyl-L-alanine amidase [Zoogloea sp.]|uniref:N-acetylmuramoyl-L-alanine amidase family protein n=1 Tax=Zoogloea sp. TaxID=49181 RepID=UPI00261EA9FA|nr:N-acetylmuramoyl-L-alanine amidase [Zoogloea sp.]MDD3327121.1 N-acetylmuramoyl-L-alanine amidase [Zoogloea sp.]